MISPRLIAWLAGIGLLVIAFGVQQARIMGLEVKVAERDSTIAALKQDRAEVVSTAEKAARNQIDEYRQREQILQKERDETEAKRLKQQADNVRAAAAHRRERDGLRHDIADYARGRSAAENTLASCNDRAATLGLLLADSLSVQDDLAEAAESHAADLRSLRAWADSLKDAQ